MSDAIDPPTTIADAAVLASQQAAVRPSVVSPAAAGSASGGAKASPVTLSPSPTLPNKKQRLDPLLCADTSEDEEEAMNEEEEPTKPAAKSAAQLFYESQEDKDKRAILLAMCVGLNKAEKGGDKFCVVSQDPVYSQAANKKAFNFKYSAKQLQQEIRRRHFHKTGQSSVKCSSFKTPRSIEWLQTNPITDKADVAWLLSKEAEFRMQLVASQTSPVSVSRGAGAPSASNQSESWTDAKAYLRLYHILCDDTVKAAYLGQFKWQGREGTDARNSDEKPKTCWELAAELYNDKNHVVNTESLAFLDSSFAESFSITTDTEGVPSNVGPDKLKQIIMAVKAKLMKVISNWEASGNGSGQRADNDSSFGHIVDGQKWKSTSFDDDGEQFMEGDNRSSFLGKNKPHLLYMWHLFDVHDLLSTTMQKLDGSVAGSSDAVPDVAVVVTAQASSRSKKKKAEEKKKKKEEAKKKEGYDASVAVSMAKLATDNRSAEFRRSQEYVVKLAREIREETDPVIKELLEQQLADAKVCLQTLRESITTQEKHGALGVLKQLWKEDEES